MRDRRASRDLSPRVRRESGAQFVHRVLKEQRRGGGPAFAVVPIGSDDVIGQIRLIHWSQSERSAGVGLWLRRRTWGRGFGTDALRLVYRYGFGTMSLRRIDAFVVSGNLGSRRVLEKVGFQQEGIRRSSVRLSGRWVDQWAFGLLPEEFREGKVNVRSERTPPKGTAGSG
ncbi:MAG: GNAT family N-acetyltransferase [Thermoplasmata archaeon]|nr:GNAT family N-acetyltransferase [Thermoplasmata archaeon]